MITEVVEFRDPKRRCEDALSRIAEGIRNQWLRKLLSLLNFQVLFFSLCREATPSISAVCDTLGHDTVGAVALDRSGTTAAATSTGGITAKRPGRVGDSPIVGKHHHWPSQANPTFKHFFLSSFLTFSVKLVIVDMLRFNQALYTHIYFDFRDSFNNLL